MDSHVNMLGSKLLSSTLALTLPQGMHGKDASQPQGWNVVKVGRPGREVNMVRYTWYRPDLSFRKVTIEIGFDGGGRMAGPLFLPAGLKKSEGVRLQVDGHTPAGKYSFSGFTPKGCLVTLGMTSEFVSAMRAGQTLNIIAHKSSNGEKIIFGLPLEGFSQAIDGLWQLLNGATA